MERSTYYNSYCKSNRGEHCAYLAASANLHPSSNETRTRVSQLRQRKKLKHRATRAPSATPTTATHATTSKSRRHLTAVPGKQGCTNSSTLRHERRLGHSFSWGADQCSPFQTPSTPNPPRSVVDLSTPDPFLGVLQIVGTPNETPLAVEWPRPKPGMFPNTGRI